MIQKNIFQNKFFILHEGPLGVFNDTLKEVSYDELQENKEIVESTTNGWIGYTDHYWQVAIFPDTNESFKARFKTLNNRRNSIQIDFINDQEAKNSVLDALNLLDKGQLRVCEKKIVSGMLTNG